METAPAVGIIQEDFSMIMAQQIFSNPFPAELNFSEKFHAPEQGQKPMSAWKVPERIRSISRLLSRTGPACTLEGFIALVCPAVLLFPHALMVAPRRSLPSSLPFISFPNPEADLSPTSTIHKETFFLASSAKYGILAFGNDPTFGECAAEEGDLYAPAYFGCRR